MYLAKSIRDHIIFTAGKKVALVVMDRKEYMKKAKILLEDSITCRLIPTDPTNKQSFCFVLGLGIRVKKLCT